MELLGIHHVSINVSDLDETVVFYTDTLGMKVLLNRPDDYISAPGRWLECPNGQQVHLIHQPMPDNRGQHFAFRVSDLDEVRKTLSDQGIELGRDREMPGICRQASCADPSGNRVEFNQPF